MKPATSFPSHDPQLLTWSARPHLGLQPGTPKKSWQVPASFSSRSNLVARKNTPQYSALGRTKAYTQANTDN